MFAIQLGTNTAKLLWGHLTLSSCLDKKRENRPVESSKEAVTKRAMKGKSAHHLSVAGQIVSLRECVGGGGSEKDSVGKYKIREQVI